MIGEFVYFSLFICDRICDIEIKKKLHVVDHRLKSCTEYSLTVDLDSGGIIHKGKSIAVRSSPRLGT